jgi:phasin
VRTKKILKQLKGKTMSFTSNHDQSISTAVENIRDFNVKMIDMAHTNMEALFGFARQLATAKAPSDIMELWTTHARKQFETLTEQTKELTVLGQKMAGENAAPIVRSVNPALKKVS